MESMKCMIERTNETQLTYYKYSKHTVAVNR